MTQRKCVFKKIKIKINKNTSFYYSYSIFYIVPELNWVCTAGETVVLRKTIGASWFLQHTNFVLKKLLCSNAKTRRLSDGCNGILRKANPQVCRAGGLQPKEMVCQRHFDKIWREDLHSHAIPHHFFPTPDQAGFVGASNVINDHKCNKGPKCNNYWP